MPDIGLSILSGAVLAFVICALVASIGMIVALRDDCFLDLLQDPRLIDVANDPALASRIKKFDLQKALDYATQK